ncbi:MAG TPA: copper oxidase [Epsilonproteobacteria bacterium]|nr:copper oxidase [Campylobacterota bacterium]
MKRRNFLTLSSVTALYVLTGCGGGSSSSSSTSSGSTTTVALPIPDLLKATDKNGIQHYDLTIQEEEHSFFDGINTQTFAINGTYLAPTLLIQDGDNVSINYTNTLTEDTTMHGHGMHVPANMDGTAHQVIAAGDTWSAVYTVNQKACTNWYHPHALGTTAKQVYQGLAGLIIIEDTESKALDLPNRYGTDDIPLVLQDRYFSSDKTAFDYSPSNQEIVQGYIGDNFITNGAIEPTFNAEAKEIRFRILNGSNSSMYDLGFSDAKSFKQIASDNAFLESPVSMSRLTLSPGERAEIVVDFSNDKGSIFTFKEFNNDKTFLTVDVNNDATATTTLPNTLTTLDPIETSVKTRTFTLERTNGKLTINQKEMDLNRIDETLNLEDVEIWEVTNNMNVNHNFHIHATHFRVIERDGSIDNVPENEKGYKDVVHLAGNASVKLLVKMTDFTDSTIPYMYHCHFLEHEDDGMMGQFTVI